MENKKSIIKIILLGESGVGKTCLIQAYLGKKIIDVPSTISSEYINKPLERENEIYNIHMWDTAGQERFRSLNKIFIKDSQIVVFVYDVTKKKTFDELPFWVNYAKELLGDHAVFGLAGNKVDLFDQIQNEENEDNDNDIEENEEKNDHKLVDVEEGQKFADEIGALFKETSAKENAIGFQEFINQLINIFFTRRKVTEREWELISLNKINENLKTKKICC